MVDVQGAPEPLERHAGPGPAVECRPQEVLVRADAHHVDQARSELELTRPQLVPLVPGHLGRAVPGDRQLPADQHGRQVGGARPAARFTGVVEVPVGRHPPVELVFPERRADLVVAAHEVGVEEVDCAATAVRGAARVCRPVPVMQGEGRVDLLELYLELVEQNTMPCQEAHLFVDVCRLVDLVLLEPDRDRVGRAGALRVGAVVQFQDRVAQPAPLVRADMGHVAADRCGADRRQRPAVGERVEVIRRVCVGPGAQVCPATFMDHVDVCRAGAGVDDVGVAVRRDVVDDLADIDHRPPRLAQAYRQDEAAPVLDHAADSSEHHTTSLPPSAQGRTRCPPRAGGRPVRVQAELAQPLRFLPQVSCLSSSASLPSAPSLTSTPGNPGRPPVRAGREGYLIAGGGTGRSSRFPRLLPSRRNSSSCAAHACAPKGSYVRVPAAISWLSSSSRCAATWTDCAPAPTPAPGRRTAS